MKKEYMKLFFAGMLSSFPFSFISFPPFMVIGFYIFFKELSLSPCVRSTLLSAFFFGFGHNLFGMHWIFFPLTFDERFINFAPITPIIFASFFALFICFPSLFIYFFIKKTIIKKTPLLKLILDSYFLLFK